MKLSYTIISTLATCTRRDYWRQRDGHPVQRPRHPSSPPGTTQLTAAPLPRFVWMLNTPDERMHQNRIPPYSCLHQKLKKVTGWPEHAVLLRIWITAPTVCVVGTLQRGDRMRRCSFIAEGILETSAGKWHSGGLLCRQVTACGHDLHNHCQQVTQGERESIHPFSGPNSCTLMLNQSNRVSAQQKSMRSLSNPMSNMHIYKTCPL